MRFVAAAFLLVVAADHSRTPLDNFGPIYHRINESLFGEAIAVDDNPTFPYPTFAANDDPTPITEQPIVKIFGTTERRRAQSLRTTTQEPDHRLPIATASAGRFQTYETEPIVLASSPSPPIDWLDGSGDEETTTAAEPFVVTESLKAAFATPNSPLSLRPPPTISPPSFSAPTAPSISPSIFGEIPTMRMYPWEMQRGDIDIRGAKAPFPSAPPSGYSPLSPRRPKPPNSISPNSLLLPQELTDDGDLPRTYAISPRLVWPQEGSGIEEEVGKAPSALPNAPPSLRPPIGENALAFAGPPAPAAAADELLGTRLPDSFAPFRPRGPPGLFSAVPSVPADSSDSPISATLPPIPPAIVPPTLRPVPSAIPEIPDPIIDEDEEFLPPLPFLTSTTTFRSPLRTLPSSTTTTSRPLTTTTPYFTEFLIPKHPKIGDAKAEYPTAVPRQRVTVGSFGRERGTGAFDPNPRPTRLPSFPTVRLPATPQRIIKHFDFPSPPPTAFSSSLGQRPAVFVIPASSYLSTAKAVQIRAPAGAPAHIHFTPRHLLKNVVPTLPPKPQKSSQLSPSFFLSTVHRNDQPNSTEQKKPKNAQWIPLGLSAPKRLGAVKLHPANSVDSQIQLKEDADAVRLDDRCPPADPNDGFEDIKSADREMIKKCFRRIRHCILHDVVPMERRIGYTEEQCVNFCGHHPFCRSAVFVSTMSICDVFDRRNGSSPARTVSHSGVVYYEPLSAVAIDCWRENLDETFFTKSPQSSVLVDSDDEEERRAKATPVVVAPKDNCEPDEDVIVLKSSGFRLKHFGVVPLNQNSSETECVFSCLVNLARGHIPYECASASFGSPHDCLIYRSAPSNRGNSHLIPQADFTHYEKTCVSRRLVDLCRGYPIIRQPQHSLLGFARKAVAASSLMDCLVICYADFEEGGGCRSVMYYYEERRDNCVLNTESRQTMPQFFIDETDELVDYASFETCLDARAELRHKALKETAQRKNRISDRPFTPKAISPTPGLPYRETTAVYTSTSVTRPPPQIFGTVFVSKALADKPHAINTSLQRLYIGDEKSSAKKKQRKSEAVKKVLVNSEEEPRVIIHGRPPDPPEPTTTVESPLDRLSRQLFDSIRRIAP